MVLMMELEKRVANGPWTMSLADSYVQPWPHDQKAEWD